jgi:hypothetical protein
MLNHLNRSARIDGYPRGDVHIPESARKAVRMCGCFYVKDDPTTPCFCESLKMPLGGQRHEVGFISHIFWCRQSLYKTCPKGNGRHKLAIHNIKLDGLRSAPDKLRHNGMSPGQVTREYGGYEHRFQG